MAIEHEPQDSPPPIPPAIEDDEGYWSALLDEGEFSSGGPITNGDMWSAYPDFDGSFHGNGVGFPKEQDWTLAVQTFDQDEAITLKVSGFNRGGLLATWNSLRGFVPASQLVDFPVDISEDRRRELLSHRVGEDLSLRIIELDIDANRLILSERAAQAQPGQREELLYSLESGTTSKGVVTNLCDFGAFVDLGGVEGLIHISELSWGRVGHPRDILESGQEVNVFLMSVDPDEERIALSLKRLQPDPWEAVEKKYEVGQVVEGTITNVVDFGAFACIEDGLEGLIHISELAEGQFLHPRNVVKEGSTIQARILNIDGPKRRLGLSLRQLGSNGFDDHEKHDGQQNNHHGPERPQRATGF